MGITMKCQISASRFLSCLISEYLLYRGQRPHYNGGNEYQMTLPEKKCFTHCELLHLQQRAARFILNAEKQLQALLGRVGENPGNEVGVCVTLKIPGC